MVQPTAILTKLLFHEQGNAIRCVFPTFPLSVRSPTAAVELAPSGNSIDTMDIVITDISFTYQSSLTPAGIIPGGQAETALASSSGRGSLPHYLDVSFTVVQGNEGNRQRFVAQVPITALFRFFAVRSQRVSTNVIDQAGRGRPFSFRLDNLGHMLGSKARTTCLPPNVALALPQLLALVAGGCAQGPPNGSHISSTVTVGLPLAIEGRSVRSDRIFDPTVGPRFRIRGVGFSSQRPLHPTFAKDIRLLTTLAAAGSSEGDAGHLNMPGLTTAKIVAPTQATSIVAVGKRFETMTRYASVTNRPASVVQLHAKKVPELPTTCALFPHTLSKTMALVTNPSSAFQGPYAYSAPPTAPNALRQPGKVFVTPGVAGVVMRIAQRARSATAAKIEDLALRADAAFLSTCVYGRRSVPRISSPSTATPAHATPNKVQEVSNDHSNHRVAGSGDRVVARPTGIHVFVSTLIGLPTETGADATREPSAEEVTVASLEHPVAVSSDGHIEAHEVTEGVNTYDNSDDGVELVEVGAKALDDCRKQVATPEEDGSDSHPTELAPSEAIRFDPASAPEEETVDVAEAASRFNDRDADAAATSPSASHYESSPTMDRIGLLSTPERPSLARAQATITVMGIATPTTPRSSTARRRTGVAETPSRETGAKNGEADEFNGLPTPRAEPESPQPTIPRSGNATTALRDKPHPKRMKEEAVQATEKGPYPEGDTSVHEPPKKKKKTATRSKRKGAAGKKLHRKKKQQKAKEQKKRQRRKAAAAAAAAAEVA